MTLQKGFKMTDEQMHKLAQDNINELASVFIKELAIAAYMGIQALEQNKKEAIEKINEQAAQKAKKILKALDDAQKEPPIKVVRKYWGGVKQDHFFGDQSKINSSTESSAS